MMLIFYWQYSEAGKYQVELRHSGRSPKHIGRSPKQNTRKLFYLSQENSVRQDII